MEEMTWTKGWENGTRALSEPKGISLLAFYRLFSQGRANGDIMTLRE
jgi:hypothetical protein